MCIRDRYQRRVHGRYKMKEEDFSVDMDFFEKLNTGETQTQKAEDGQPSLDLVAELDKFSSDLQNMMEADQGEKPNPAPQPSEMPAISEEKKEKPAPTPKPIIPKVIAAPVVARPIPSHAGIVAPIMKPIPRNPANDNPSDLHKDPPKHKESDTPMPVSYTHLRAHETSLHLVCRLLLEKKKQKYHKLEHEHQQPNDVPIAAANA
eukprot:TRINITY_DN2323_c0_g1_i1.p2 TRINITY_DN2323_c0_g1~~TRINITY_DN2323_c0_g1_i1.p2  ORF type:complete len:205 (-),score=54.23 TRINITY_DN2323_c0_g1_i1:31-645(-)